MRRTFVRSAALLFFTLSGAEAEELDALRQRIEALEQSAPSAANRGILELGSADTVLTIGGRVQLDAAYSSPESRYFAKLVPLSSEGEEGQLSMSARDSRLWVKARRPSSLGMVRTLIEIDFWGASGTETNTNAHGPRLRHAYIDVGGLAVGQTNSLYNAFVTLDTITYAVNDTLVRQPLIRYSRNGKTWGYDFSLEQPETTLSDPDGRTVTPKDDRLPDIGARLRCYPDWGRAGIAAMVRYIRQDRATLGDGTALERTDAAWGWGLNASAQIKAGRRDDLRFDLQYGDGIGRYLAYDVFTAGTVDAAGNIRLQRSYGGHLGYRHWWRGDLRSTLGVSHVGTEREGEPAGTLSKRVTGIQANLIWTPLPNGLVSLEYASAEREVESGEKGDLQLLRLTLRYTF